MRSSIVALALLAVTTAPQAAFAAGKGSSTLSLGLGQGSAETYGPTNLGFATGSYLEPGQTPETNVGAEYWYGVSDNVSLALAGAYGMSRMEWESSDSADPKIKATGTSFKARLGADYVGKLSDRLHFFMGPGLEYWSGKSKLDVGGTETEGESVTRVGVSGRLGGFMMLSESVGIMGQVGHTFGYASVDDGGASSNWSPSSFNASWGLSFSFGSGK